MSQLVSTDLHLVSHAESDGGQFHSACDSFLVTRLLHAWKTEAWKEEADDDDVELNILGCLVNILGTNCDQCLSMVQCCFTSTETVSVGRGAQDGHLDCHTIPEL